MDDLKRYQMAYERYLDGKISRRTFLRMMAVAGAAVGVGGLGLTREALAEVSTIRYDDWGGTTQEAERKAFGPFTKKTGVKVEDGSFNDDMEFLAKVRASKEGTYNVFKSGEIMSYGLALRFGLGTKLNEDNIPNLDLVMEGLIDPLRALRDDRSLSGVPNDYGLNIWAYNKNKVDLDELKEKGQGILVDPKYKGKVSAWDDWQSRIWAGAVITGQNPNAIDDIDPVWDSIKQAKNNVLKFWSSGSEQMSLMANEEIWVAEMWSGRAANLAKELDNIGLYIPEGSFFWQEQLFVLKGSPMEAAEVLLNFLLEPDIQMEVAVGQAYAPALNPHMVDVPDEVRAIPGFDPTGEMEGYLFDDAFYWLDHQEEWSRQYERVKTRG